MTLDRDYLQQFDDFSIERFLLEEADLGELEREIESQTTDFKRIHLHVQFGSLLLQGPKGKKELKYELKKIKQIVDEFYQVEGTPSPRISMHNFWWPEFLHPESIHIKPIAGYLSSGLCAYAAHCFSGDTEPMSLGFSVAASLGMLGFTLLSRKIRLGGPRMDASEGLMLLSKDDSFDHQASTIGHEYGHLVQYKKGMWPRVGFKPYAIMEGLSRAAEREVAIAFQTQTGREQFVYMPLALGHSELLTAYHWICDQRSLDKGRLKEPVTDISKGMIAEYQRKGKLSPYQLGNAFITLLEMQNGPSVSADILNGRFSRTKL